MDNDRPRRPGELAFAAVMLALAAFVLYQAHGISGFSSPSSPGVFPMLAAGAMVASGLVIVLRTRRIGWRGAAATRFGSEITPRRHIVFAGMIVAYMIALEPLGFLLSSFAFLLASIHYLYRKGIMVELALSAGSLAAVYLVFRYVFTVVLPEGEIFR
jgi:putative tricarboxylic transport membrane protein